MIFNSRSQLTRGGAKNFMGGQLSNLDSVKEVISHEEHRSSAYLMVCKEKCCSLWIPKVPTRISIANLEKIEEFWKPKPLSCCRIRIHWPLKGSQSLIQRKRKVWTNQEKTNAVWTKLIKGKSNSLLLSTRRAWLPPPPICRRECTAHS